jgi:hypothetical protein
VGGLTLNVTFRCATASGSVTQRELSKGWWILTSINLATRRCPANKVNLGGHFLAGRVWTSSLNRVPRYITWNRPSFSHCQRQWHTGDEGLIELHRRPLEQFTRPARIAEDDEIKCQRSTRQNRHCGLDRIRS